MSSGKDLAMPAGFNLVPENAADAWRLATMLAESDMVPKDYRGKPGNVMVAAAMGAELGLPPVQALQNIAVINGRPSVWGDALMALVRGHRDCEDIKETFDDSTMTATCLVKRRNQSPVEATFSQKDAELAGLWKKQGPWTQYPKRMLKLRARAFALRDAFADVLKGVAVAEEVQDVAAEMKDVTPKRDPEAPRGGTAALKAKAQAEKPAIRLDHWYQDIGQCGSMEELRQLGAKIKELDPPEPERTHLRRAMEEKKRLLLEAEAEDPPEAAPLAEDAQERSVAAFARYQQQLEIVEKAPAIQEIVDLFQNDDDITTEQRGLLADLAAKKLDDSIPY